MQIFEHQHQGSLSSQRLDGIGHLSQHPLARRPHLLLQFIAARCRDDPGYLYQPGRRVLVQQLAILELAPQGRWNRLVEHGGIVFGFSRRLPARDDTDDERIAEDELQRGCRQRHPVRLTHGIDRACALHDFRRRFCVVIGGAPGENPRVVRSARDDAHAAFRTFREKRVERYLLEQRIAAGEEKEIGIDELEQPRARFPFVDARADRLHFAPVAQLREGAPTPRFDQLLDARLGCLTPAMHQAADVVHVENVDAIDTQALQARFVRAHYAVV